MKRIIGLIVVVTILASTALHGCASKADGAAEAPSETERRLSVVDLAGRTVEMEVPAERVVAIGPGALRLVCYAGGAQKVVGIEEFETRWPAGRPYMVANEPLLKLPIVGPGGPDSAPDAERIMSVKPDVVFAAQILDKAAADKLQRATGVPVVVLSYGQVGSFGEDVFRSIELVGEVLGTEQHAARVVGFVRDALRDLRTRTASIPASQKPSVYVGGLGFKGARGIDSTQGDYPPFSAIGAASVTSELAEKGSVMVDKEKILAWDPEYIFIDRGGLDLVKEDISKNRGYYEQLSAFKSGKVYALLPFNYYWTNLELALADAYYAGKVLFPDAFSDVQPERKADEIARAMLGAPVYEQVAQANGGGFGQLDLLGSQR